MVGRVAAVVAVAMAVVVVAVILLSGGSSYQVNAVFEDASQIVSGDQVQIGGNTVGTVSKIALTKAARPSSRSASTTRAIRRCTRGPRRPCG